VETFLAIASRRDERRYRPEPLPPASIERVLDAVIAVPVSFAAAARQLLPLPTTGAERALARNLADEHDHDLSDLATYEDIKTAATDGSLRVDVTDENVYVTSGLADDLADGPESVDREQLELAVELLRDVGEYAEDDIVDEILDADMPLGRLVAHVLDPNTVSRPNPPYAKAIEQWESLETFLESRLRQE